MPAAVVPISRSREGQYALLQWALPGAPVHNIGVLLLDAATGRLYRRFREHWQDIADPEDVELLTALEEDFDIRIAEMGGDGFLRSLEDSLSNVLRITDREAVAVDAFTRALDRLFDQHVDRVAVKPYRSHLPLFSLRAAATKFGDDEQVEEEDWVRAPERLKLHEGMFVVHVVGRSMEPRIPDGSLNVFRAPVVGSRQNKIVLVELFGQLETSARYTVKRYTSKKTYSSEDDWQHTSIRLEPLNPEFEAFELQEGQFRTIAEWVCTLE